MKTWILIEADTEFYSLTAWGTTRKEDGSFDLDSKLCMVNSNVEQFFGELNTLLPTRTKLEEAGPMKLPKIDTHAEIARAVDEGLDKNEVFS